VWGISASALTPPPSLGGARRQKFPSVEKAKPSPRGIRAKTKQFFGCKPRSREVCSQKNVLFSCECHAARTWFFRPTEIPSLRAPPIVDGSPDSSPDFLSISLAPTRLMLGKYGLGSGDPSTITRGGSVAGPGLGRNDLVPKTTFGPLEWAQEFGWEPFSSGPVT